MVGDETQIWSYGIRVEACGAIYCWCSPIRGGMGVGGSGSRKPSRECFFFICERQRQRVFVYVPHRVLVCMFGVRRQRDMMPSCHNNTAHSLYLYFFKY